MLLGQFVLLAQIHLGAVGVFSFYQILQMKQLREPLYGEPSGFNFPSPGQMKLCGQKDRLLAGTKYKYSC